MAIKMEESFDPLMFHDYCIRSVKDNELNVVIEMERKEKDVVKKEYTPDDPHIEKEFSKCDKCRKSRTKLLVPNAILSITHGKNDGVTCDFCGDVMNLCQPKTLPNVFEGRRGSKGGDVIKNNKRKNYVYCNECGKVVLKESLNKHVRDVHETSNKKQCHICLKLLSGTFSLKEHISAVHNKQTKHKCPQCDRTFAHFSNMNRHIRLIHNKMVVTQKYVNCSICNVVVQAISLKKHMAAIHEGRRDYKCQYCDKTFAQSFTCKEHISAKHTLQHSHKCALCNKTFAHKTNCGRHIKTVHKEETKGKYENDYELYRSCIQRLSPKVLKVN